MRRPRKPEAPGPPRACLHFVGFRDDRWWSAIKVFGRPDFVHPRWDQRARREIADGDTIIFAAGDEAQPVARFNAPDFIEADESISRRRR